MLARQAARGVVVSIIYVPNSLAKALLGRDNYDTITVRTTSIAVTSAVAKALASSCARCTGCRRYRE